MLRSCMVTLEIQKEGQHSCRRETTFGAAASLRQKAEKGPLSLSRQRRGTLLGDGE